jgi:two-component system, chemotaxis family, CheB/CheR fusion protein
MAGKKDQCRPNPDTSSSSTSPNAPAPSVKSRRGKAEQRKAEQEERRTAQDTEQPPADDTDGSEEPSADTPKPFPIVGIGASAGGLEALEAFFAQVPADCGMAFVVITHTDPDHSSMLPELLQRKARIPVKSIEAGMPVEAGMIYIPPTDRDPFIEQDAFQLKKRPGRAQGHMPVDLFFKSLAAERGERAVCIVLSGTGSDGTQGLRLIKERSGLTVVQRSDSARHAGMPDSALSTGLVDFVLAPAQMPERLLEYFRNPAAIQAASDEVSVTAGPEPLRRIIHFLAQRTRHDFSLYKSSTLVRRIERRMTVTRSRSPDAYLQFLHRNGDETRALFQDLLIGVTSFFRDPEAFEHLKQNVVPDLIARTREDDVLRTWIAGCATGEEAYSVAIIFKECLDERNTIRQLQMFGTDIDDKAVEKARQGVFLQNIAADVSPARLKRFFTKEGDYYRVNSEIRESVVFAEQNILRDPPFSSLDLLVCRNLLIYLRPEAQERLLPLFHYTLKKDGCLFLGTSESIGRFHELFKPLSKAYSIYRKKDSLLRPQVQFPTGARGPKSSDERAGHEAPRPLEHFSVAQAVERILLKEHTPAAVIINASGEILHIHGRTGKYLEPAEGKPTLRIADMAREGLRFALMSALRRTVEQKQPVREHDLRVKTNGAYQRVALTVQPLTAEPLKGCHLVLFEDLPAIQGDSGPERQRADGDDADGRIEALERELMRVRHDYQGAVEELESSNEELRSVNEEMHSSNEELQSSNEELESSREELQSLNEELNTVNSELHTKIDQLDEAYGAITQVLNATRIAVVFLDTDLCVRRFTEEASRLINLIDSDVGRPIKHIAANLAGENLAFKAEQVLKQLAPFEGEVQTNDGHWYRMAILVHRNQDQIEGVVLTFVNIDVQKNAQRRIEEMTAQAVRSVQRFAESIVDTVRESLLVLNTSQMRVVTANRRFYETFRTGAEQTEGRSLFELGGGQWDSEALRTLLAKIVRDGQAFDDYRVERRFDPVGEKRLLLNGRLLREDAPAESKILLAIEDITEMAGPADERDHDR